MPALAAWLGSLFTSLVSFLALYVSKRVAIIAAAIAALVVLTTLFVIAIETTIAALILATPSQVTMAVEWLVPSNVDECLYAYMSTRIARWLYDMKTAVIMMKTN